MRLKRAPLIVGLFLLAVSFIYVPYYENDPSGFEEGYIHNRGYSFVFSPVDGSWGSYAQIDYGRVALTSAAVITLSFAFSLLLEPKMKQDSR